MYVFMYASEPLDSAVTILACMYVYINICIYIGSKRVPNAAGERAHKLKASLRPHTLIA